MYMYIHFSVPANFFCLTQFCFDKLILIDFYFNFCAIISLYHLQKLYCKNKTFAYDYYNSCAQLFGTSTFFIHPEASIGVL